MKCKEVSSQNPHAQLESSISPHPAQMAQVIDIIHLNGEKQRWTAPEFVRYFSDALIVFGLWLRVVVLVLSLCRRYNYGLC